MAKMSGLYCMNGLARKLFAKRVDELMFIFIMYEKIQIITYHGAMVKEKILWMRY
jgi:hypothetical protein